MYWIVLKTERGKRSLIVTDAPTREAAESNVRSMLERGQAYCLPECEGFPSYVEAYEQMKRLRGAYIGRMR